jgi:hypothetical protein
VEALLIRGFAQGIPVPGFVQTEIPFRTQL